MSKWWGIRHIRWLGLRIQFAVWWIFIGSKYWMVASSADLDYMKKVKNGEA